jgi:hypothetical protein
MGGKRDPITTPRFSELEARAFRDLAFPSRCAPTTSFTCCRRCFGRWLRERQLEHWRGEQHWRELDRGDFGVLRRPIHANDALVADIVAMLASGAENLGIIAWALEIGQRLDDVVAILAVLDVNARRLPPFGWLTLVERCS